MIAFAELTGGKSLLHKMVMNLYHHKHNEYVLPYLRTRSLAAEFREDSTMRLVVYRAGGGAQRCLRRRRHGRGGLRLPVSMKKSG